MQWTDVLLMCLIEEPGGICCTDGERPGGMTPVPLCDDLCTLFCLHSTAVESLNESAWQFLVDLSSSSSRCGSSLTSLVDSRACSTYSQRRQYLRESEVAWSNRSTPCPEKGEPIAFFGITSSNTSRFSKFFQYYNLAIKLLGLLNFPPHLKRVATLPCEKLMS